MRALVIGVARTGEAVARHLRAERWDVVVTDDRPGGPSYEACAARVRAAGATIVEAPGVARYEELIASSDLVVPSPLVPPFHPAIVAALARGVALRGEIDLAAERSRVPLIAITGTNGKTTVTGMIAAMLEASGVRAAAAGNIGRTLLDATQDDAAVLVAEVSSFQLAFAPTLRPRVAVLLGLAEDHLDWHGSFDHYVEAKCRIFANQGRGDLLVVDTDDDVARVAATRARSRVISVSTTPALTAVARYGVRDGVLVTADGATIMPVHALRRALPHDLTNALIAAAAALEAGATLEGVRRALSTYTTLPHRVMRIGEHGGVRYYDDSKATNPHATVHAVVSFDSVVLLAGGRNKGLDLTTLTTVADHIRAIVAFGEAGAEVARAFAGIRPVTQVASMNEAVRAAHTLAAPGDVVLLSPACASFDAYENYAARGDDFAREVHALLTEAVG
ncbi:MAG: UDP-N-acetylmuramoyl-L-alanine--D-glutamate ligase [Actinomycetota bacterium]